MLEVLKNNPFVQNVALIGVADHLVDEIRQEITSISSGARYDVTHILDKVTFVKESELSSITLEGAFKRPIGSTDSIYISIDKDALTPAYAATNWDQGSLDVATLKRIIESLAENHKILGIDICGERAKDFEGDEHHTVQEADTLNNNLNSELVDFLQKLKMV